MRDILRGVFAKGDGGPDDHSAPTDPAGRPDAESTESAFGKFVRVTSAKVEILGTTYPRRPADARGGERLPDEFRRELSPLIADEDGAERLVPERPEVFLHITRSMAGTLGRIAEIESNPRLRTFVLLTGPTGCGKTTIAKTYCHLANEPCVELTFSGDTTLADFFRRTEVVRDAGGQSTVAALGPAVQAMLRGHKLLINEINMLPPDLLSALTQAMDTGRLVLSGTDLGNIEIEVDERFGIFATANPGYVGTAEIGQALRRRFGAGLGHIPMTFLPAAEEVEAVAFEFEQQPLMRSLALTANTSIVERVVGVARQLRSHEDHGGQMRDRISTRSLVHWLSLGSATGLPLAEVAEDAVLSIAPDAVYPQVAALTRTALGNVTTAASYPEQLRGALLSPEAPDAGAAVPVPDPAEAAPPAEADAWVGDSSGSIALGDGREVRVASRPDEPPRVEARNPDGTPIGDLTDIRRALREEFGLNLVQRIGHVPGPDEVLPCLTRASWTAVRLAQATLLFGRPVFLRGPTGSGKSALSRTIARLWNLPVVEFSFTGETTKSELTAARRLRHGATQWSLQAFLEAVGEGLFVIVNEYNLAYPDVHSIINGLFDKGGRLMLPDGRTIRAHPDFRLVATGFPEGPGVKPLNEGVENRFGAVIRVDYPPLQEELAILTFVSEGRVDAPVLSSVVELAATGRQILDGVWEAQIRHPLSKVPPDLAAAVAERLALTTAELVSLAHASPTTEWLVDWYRRGVQENAPDDIARVLRACMAGYGLN